ncbi:protein of unknown function [Petrocella atlantisensis]|uniref:Uncharacterized protein n=1 Tax=Petrocella atlantisensis TaxID=2173034 RepID=A0A3P7S3U5_9FIRM|nr:protein of unknown function [Petrocella atlantisensis]
MLIPAIVVSALIPFTYKIYRKSLNGTINKLVFKGELIMKSICVMTFMVATGAHGVSK